MSYKCESKSIITNELNLLLMKENELKTKK